MSEKVYIETSIVSYLVARPSRNLVMARRQQLTREWWERRRPEFDLYVSDLVRDESAAGDPSAVQRRLEALASIPMLQSTSSVEILTSALITEHSLPSKATADAAHVALATVHRCEYLLTWNCRHLANVEVQRTARVVAQRHGFDLPLICTPEQFMGGSE